MERAKKSLPLLAIFFLAVLSKAQTVMSVLAAQIRSQGFACDEPQKATRDAKLSKPDYDVWILTCKNATYRIGRYADMAAKVETEVDRAASLRLHRTVPAHEGGPATFRPALSTRSSTAAIG
ncbi:hypothetical protein [Bradyrhizobium valentinum]|uniref:hypothetical protein n=1 Tax=Bradyrhizobium valentinum TaxID=1518501 RepID=UPI0007C6B079|nr:hypothetical protein [Bradyrhizobium valentinum]